MSLLRFLRVIESIDPTATRPTRTLPRSRRLLLEVLEGRAVLATLDNAPLVDPPPVEAPTIPPVLESPSSDPAAPAGEGAPIDDPLFEDPVVVDRVLQPPVITSLLAQREGDWVRLTGSVADADGPVEGLTVYFMVGDGTTVAFTAIVRADGTFESADYMIPSGTTVSAYTIDIDGNQSEIVNTVV